MEGRRKEKGSMRKKEHLRWERKERGEWNRESWTPRQGLFSWRKGTREKEAEKWKRMVGEGVGKDKVS